jgi:hypothetical protein
MFRLIFLGIISLFLLGLYAYGIGHSIQVLLNLNAKPACTDCLTTIGNGVKLIISTVGGLISALVISVLAITPPNGSPARTVLNSVQPPSLTATVSVSDLTVRLTNALTYAYLAVWLICGIMAVVYGVVIDYKTPVAELTAAAQSWLGLAITAAYAFFGLKTQ